MRRWLIRGVLIFLGVLLVLVLCVHPYFALHRPVGAPVLVAEGWMHRAGLKATADLFHGAPYEHLYITGNPRPVAYYLAHREGLELEMEERHVGVLEWSIDGLPGTPWHMIVDGDTIRAGVVGKDAKDQQAAVQRPVRTIQVGDGSTASAGPDVPLLFLGRLELDGINAHTVVGEVHLIRPDGTHLPGWPTQAHEAMALLADHGIPMARMTVIPNQATRDRTNGSARTFAGYARTHGIDAYDVVTLAVHARRTHQGHLNAVDEGIKVGVIALQDPWCGRWTWWMNYYGWYQVLKELAALPRTWAKPKS